MTINGRELKADLRALRDLPTHYGQEDHGELHGEALAAIRRLERDLRDARREARYWRSLTHVRHGGARIE